MEQRVFVANYGNQPEELNALLASGWAMKEIHAAAANANVHAHWLVLAQKRNSLGE